MKIRRLLLCAALLSAMCSMLPSAYGQSDEFWSQFTMGVGFYDEAYSLPTEMNTYNDIYLSVYEMISVGGKSTGYSPFLIPAEYYMYDETGEGFFEKIYLLPVLKGSKYGLTSEDVFPLDENGRQAWGTEAVDHYYFIDQEKFIIAYKESSQPYVGETIINDLQELPWPHYIESNRRVILYPVTEEYGTQLGKNYDNDNYDVPNFYVDTDMYDEDIYRLLPKVSVIESADNWAITTLEQAINEGISTDRMSKMYYKMLTTRAEFSELIMKLYEKLEGPEVEVSSNPFIDTSSDDVLRANKAGIVNGLGDGRFNPDGEINREELCVMIIRSLKSAGVDILDESSFADEFKDIDQISPWAVQSMMTLNQLGIYKGDGVNIMPKKTVDKQTAVILLYRAYNYYK